MGSLIRKAFLKLLLPVLFLTGNAPLYSRQFTSYLSGTAVDAESRSPLAGADISVTDGSGFKTTVTDSLGRFKIMLSPGRHTLRAGFMGYNIAVVNDILIGPGKEVFISVMLTESTLQLGEARVGAESRKTHNTMATVSARRLKSQDAARFAAGYFDPLRMVTSMPGVSAGNDDDNNQIIIRGNSPKGMLWRIEGLEVPNPNHLAAGEGASGGAYSAVTTNALSGFDFYTGAFPAEFGNATSGVMDLNLKSGSTSKRGFALGLSVVGAEASAEGPFAKGGTGSWFVNLRYANFDFLKRYGIIDSEEVGIIPSSYDWAAKASFKSKRAGTFEIFTAGGSSVVGDLASDNADSIKNGADKDEYLDRHLFAIAGIKHLWALPDEKTYIRTTAGVTWQRDVSENHVTDTLLNRTLNYSERFLYPALRISVVANHKFSPSNTLRIGANLNFTTGDMFAQRLLNTGLYDTLLNSNASGWYNGYFAQWKYKPADNIEINTGVHVSHSGITSEVLFEPRIGMVINLAGGRRISLGAGLHSRLEPLSIYNYRIKVSKTGRDIANSELKSSRALHFTVGLSRELAPDLNAGIEAYYQHLFSVPYAVNPRSQYSVINASYGLPDIALNNGGKGTNYGAEFTIEKDFTRNWYTVMTASLFDSRYLSPDGKTYSTYYNNGYIFNLTAGREFPVGRKRQNLLGFNLKALVRGGFRYTPVDTDLSLSRKRIVYDISETYGRHLPEYRRIDLGITYRLYRASSSWIFQAEIQNITNRHNVVRKRFSYSRGVISERDSYSVGLVPVASVRYEF